jgi:dolichol-phosphate mannosyltransferase
MTAAASTGQPHAGAERAVSIILPTYNESLNIVKLVNLIKAATPAGWRSEILVVDDSSPDGTYEIVRRAFDHDGTVRAILRRTDRGFAKSIRTGIEKASFDRIIVMDSDLTHDPVEIPRLLHVGEVYDIVSASRFAAGGRMADVSHYIASMLYNWMLRVVLRTQLQDNLGGYFTTSRSLVLTLPASEIFFGYGDYYFRLLFFAQRSGCSIVEIPAQYLPRGQGASKSNWLRMIFGYFKAALLLRWRARKMAKHGRFGKPIAPGAPP